MMFRFIGTESAFAGRKFTNFGETVDLPAAAGSALIAGNCPVLPEEQFQQCGFTAEELREYAYPGPRADCSPEFEAKWKAARLALHELREALRAGGTLTAAERG